MSKATFPTQLTSKARILIGLTRLELLFLAITYFVLALFQISGILQLLILAGGLLIFKYMERKLPHGFLRFIHAKRKLNWSYKLEQK